MAKETTKMLYDLGFDISRDHTPIEMWLDHTTDIFYAKQGSRTRVLPEPK